LAHYTSLGYGQWRRKQCLKHQKKRHHHHGVHQLLYHFLVLGGIKRKSLGASRRARLERRRTHLFFGWLDSKKRSPLGRLHLFLGEFLAGFVVWCFPRRIVYTPDLSFLY
jgi:hypothetical protein